MEKMKKINYHKQLLSLKNCYEEQVIIYRALSSKVHNLENIFRLTKQYMKEKRKDHFSLKNERRYLLITKQKMTLSKNISKQYKILLKSLLFNKYQELNREKDYLLETIKEKEAILTALNNELNANKNLYPFGKCKTNIYLNNPLNLLLLNNINSDKNDYEFIKHKIGDIESKEIIDLQKKCEEVCLKMKDSFNHSILKYNNWVNQNGFRGYFINNKNNKKYILSMEPILTQKNNISSESDDSDQDTKINDVSNSINEHLFEEDFNSNNNDNTNVDFTPQKNNLKQSNLNLNSSTIKKEKVKKEKPGGRNIHITNFLNLDPNEIKNINRNNTQILDNNEKLGIITEININDRRGSELSKKLLKLKEKYYKCLDTRYELKSSLKSKISNIFIIKQKIKKIKKEKNNVV